MQFIPLWRKAHITMKTEKCLEIHMLLKCEPSWHEAFFFHVLVEAGVLEKCTSMWRKKFWPLKMLNFQLFQTINTNFTFFRLPTIPPQQQVQTEMVCCMNLSAGAHCQGSHPEFCKTCLFFGVYTFCFYVTNIF